MQEKQKYCRICISSKIAPFEEIVVVRKAGETDEKNMAGAVEMAVSDQIKE